MKISGMSPKEYEALSASVLKDKAAGLSLSKIGAKYNLNHTQVDWITYRDRITEADLEAWATIDPKYLEQCPNGTELQLRVLQGRDRKISWGMMAVLQECPESTIRKAYAAVTTLRSQGQRIGKGGRYFMQQPVLYEDVLRPTGTQIPVDAPLASAKNLSIRQRIERLSFDSQDALGAKFGMPYQKGTSRTAWLKAVLVKAGYVDPAPVKAPVKKARTQKALNPAPAPVAAEV